MTSLLIASLGLSGGLVCPIMGNPAPKEGPAYHANGIRFRFCCPPCIETFKKAPMESLKKAAEKKWVVGTSVFDPVNGRKLTPQTTRGGFSDYAGVRFHFQNPANKAAFDAEPKRFGTVPEKMAANCPIMSAELTMPFMAPAYADHNGVRYFACCDSCAPRIGNADLVAKGDAGKIGPPKLVEVPAAWQKLSGPGG